MMQEVVVVGAGPAGSSLSLRLARAGVAVALLERARFPRVKVCGEYLSPGAVSALAELGVAGAAATHGHPIRQIALSAFGCEPVVMTLPGGGASALSRAILDTHLRDAAIAAGTLAIDGAFLGLRRVDAGWRVDYRDPDGADRFIRARAIVGADGAWSSVARSAGLATNARRIGRWAVGGHARTGAAAANHTLEMFVGPGGYYARNPLGVEFVNTMLVMPAAIADEAQADEIVSAVTSGRYRFDAHSLEKRVAVGPMGYAPRACAADGVTLTGDAAGMLDPFVGQGVAIALESSAACCDALVAQLAGAPAYQTTRAVSAARRRLAQPRRALATLVDIIVRTPLLRTLALRRARHDVAAAETVLAALAGAAPNAREISPAAVARLLA